MTPDEIATLVESADPVDASEVQGWVDSPDGQRILADILAEGLPPRHRDGRKLIIPTVVALLLLATGAATYLLAPTTPTTEPRLVGCYASLDAQAETVPVGIHPEDEGLSPAEICAVRWQEIFLAPVPPSLVACVVEGGGIGVFPNPETLRADDACGSIGASLPEEGLHGGLSDARVRALSREVGARVAPLYEREDCAPAGRLVAEVRAVLREHDLTAWSVVDRTSRVQEWTHSDGTTSSEEVPTTSAGERCAAHVVDPLTAKILVINGWPRLPEA